MIFFSSGSPARICLSDSAGGPLRLAVRDLIRDLERVSGFSGHAAFPLREAQKGSVVIGALEDGGLCPLLERDGIRTDEIRGRREHYLIEASPDTLYLVGSDEMGAMWAVYEVCERFLGVDPMYLFTDHEPARMEKAEIPPSRIVDGPAEYRFRGWFINDEDLIMGYCRGGRPEKDYDFHRDYAPMLSMIVETALRMKQNLLIPASHIDMDDPAQEALVKLVTGRGMFISQHHQEPVGVNQQRLDRWFARHGDDTENINYADHPEKYRLIWRHFIRKWAKYPNVIWQLGLRGRGDRPVWYRNDRIPDTLEARGALISAAIRDQWEIIAEETGRKDFLCSSTLWMEGMPLYHAGTLRFPEGTMIVLSDFGPDQTWGKEYGETPRRPGTVYGTYYHVCFWGCGPHLVSGNRPEKILRNFAIAQKTGDTRYSVLNVSNIREHLPGIFTVAEATWRPEIPDARSVIKGWCEKALDLPDGDAAAALYSAYFDAFSHLDDTLLPGRMLLMDGMCKRVAMMLMRIIDGNELERVDIQNKRLFDFPSTGAFISFYLRAAEEGAKRFEKALKEAESFLLRIPDARRPFFRSGMILQIRTILGLYRWVTALCGAAICARSGGNEKPFDGSVRQGVLALEDILAAREETFCEKWAHWWDGDTLIDVKAMRDKTARLTARPESGKTPPVL